MLGRRLVPPSSRQARFPILAHRDRSHFGGRTSLSGHNGHGWSGGRPDPDQYLPPPPAPVAAENASVVAFMTGLSARMRVEAIPRPLPSIVVVALGEPRTPVVCWAPAGRQVVTMS